MIAVILTALVALAIWPLIRVSNRAVERERVERASRRAVLRELYEIEHHRSNHIPNHQQEEI